MSVKLLLYCTKAKPRLLKVLNKNVFYHSQSNLDFLSYYEKENVLNGKIVAECTCDKVEKWFWNGWWNCYAKNNDIDIQNIDDEDFEKSCLNFGYLYDYLFENDGYALHLSNVKVFDESRELSDYDVKEKGLIHCCGYNYTIKNMFSSCTKAPQNMCNVYDKQGNHYILISIKPEHLCKILNGEKTIEVRKKILKSLKEVLQDD